MIQDIEPKHLYNQFKNLTPQAGDLVFYFEGSTLLAKNEEGVISYPTFKTFCDAVVAQKKRPAEEVYTFIYLLAVDDVKYFLAMPTDGTETLCGILKEDKTEPFLAGYAMTGVNIFRLAKPKETAFAAITAYHLYGWYRDNRYCGRCGKLMKQDTKERMLRCDDCHNMVYPKICPAVIVAVTDGDRILLTKYAGRDYTNYALNAGFAEIGETIEQTVHREIMEEVGLKVKNLRYYKSQPWALSGTLLIGFFCELDGDDKITLEEDELATAEWFHAKDLDIEDDGVSLTREMMLKFKHDHTK